MPDQPSHPHAIDRVRRMLLAPAAMLVLITPARSLAQSRTAPPKFEVAVVKPCKPADLPPNGARGGASGNDPGRMRIACQTVERLIQWAYVTYASGEPSRAGVPPVSDQPIEGSPSWMKSETFTIEAKPEVPQTIEMMRGPMLRALLEDRFKLKLHPGTRQVSIYALAVARAARNLTLLKRVAVLLHLIFQRESPAAHARPTTALRRIQPRWERRNENIRSDTGRTQCGVLGAVGQARRRQHRN